MFFDLMTDLVDTAAETIAEGDGGASMSERVFGLISRAIIRGEIEPGAGMTEPDLARRFGISRAPLREALRRLEEQQLLERNPYRGMRVTALSRTMVEELFEIREELEGLACRRAATRITDADVVQLRAALAAERDAIRDQARDRPAEVAVLASSGPHTLTAKIAANGELVKILDSAIWRLLRADYWRRVSRRPEALRASHVEHIRIVEALSERDGELAEILMRRHIRNTLNRRIEA